MFLLLKFNQPEARMSGLWWMLYLMEGRSTVCQSIFGSLEVVIHDVICGCKILLDCRRVCEFHIVRTVPRIDASTDNSY